MFKYFMRKFVFNDVDSEAQDILIQLNTPHFILDLLFDILFLFILEVPIFLMNKYYDEDVAHALNLGINYLRIIYLLAILVITQTFKKDIYDTYQFILKKLYFWMWTKNGNALSKKDFKILKNNQKLYNRILTQKCKKHRFSVCFKICKTLKKGNISFVSIQTIKIKKKYYVFNFKMNVLYINENEDWVFDPYSCQQYPIKKFNEIFKVKVYKTFSFDDISNISYSKFKKEQKTKLTEWATSNDCSMF